MSHTEKSKKPNHVESNIDQLRMSVATAIAANSKNLTPNHYSRFRHKTAEWIDESFFKILKGCGVTGLIECGAHEASASVNFMRTGGRRAVAIEANPFTYESKTKLTEQYGVLSFNCGVGGEVGEIDFYIPLHDQNAGNASFLKKTNVKYKSKKVSVDTLDNIFREHFETNEALALWVDVEGLALEVLKGGGSLLNSENCLVIKVEVESKSFWEGQSLARDVDNYLTSFGFKAILRDLEYRNQYNVIYVKDKYIDCIDEVLIDCWREISWLRLSWLDKNDGVREFASYIKHRLTRSDKSIVSFFTHKVAAFLGSKSSN